MTKYAPYINTVIDKCIDFANQYLLGLQEPDVLVPEYMVDRDKVSPYSDIVFWKPISANISKEQFVAYENKIGFLLPETYKDFLSYKFFINLNFGHNAELFRHTGSWVEDYYDTIVDYGFEDSLNKGFIPFARDTDQGYFCFDTNNIAFGNEYRIITYDKCFEEQVYPAIKGQFTFIDLVKELEETLDAWKQRKEDDRSGG